MNPAGQAMQELDPQRVPLESGLTLIAASAGTGKTQALAMLVRRAVLAGIPLERITVLTFTEAAAAELVERVRLLLAQPVPDDADDPAAATRLLRQARRDADRHAIATIHGFCKRLLDEAAFDSGQVFDLALDADTRPQLAQAVADAFRQVFADMAPEAAWTPGAVQRLTALWMQEPEQELLPTVESAALAADRSRCAAALAQGLPIAALLGELRAGKVRKGCDGLVAALIAGLAQALSSHVLPATPVLAELAPKRLKHLINTGDGLGGGKHPCRQQRLLELMAPWQASRAELLRAEGLAPLALLGDLLAESVSRLEVEGRRRGALGFDGLLRAVRDGLADPVRGPRLVARLAERSALLLVDECQDTDPVQLEILARGFPGQPRFFIGDPKQAIYRFRGADLDAYLHAARAARDGYGLSVNYRSDPGLVAALNGLYAGHPCPLLAAELPYVPVQAANPSDALAADGPCLQFLYFTAEDAADAERQVISATVQELQRLLAAGPPLPGGDGVARPLHAGDCAILTRSNDQAEAMQEALRAARIPAVRAGTGDVRRSEAWHELCLLLAAVVEGQDPRRLRAAASTRLLGMTAAELVREHPVAEARLLDLAARCRRWRDLLASSGVLAVVGTAWEELGALGRLLAPAGGERHLTDLLHAAELLDAELRPPNAPTRILACAREWHLRAAAGELDTDRGSTAQRLESDARAVQILTIHKAKGLAFNVVFAPFLYNGRSVAPQPPYRLRLPAPDDGLGPAALVLLSATEAEKLDPETLGPQHARLAAQAQAAEAADGLRLAYVALTRARHRCYVAWGAFGRGNSAIHSPLGHLISARSLDPDTLSTDPTERHRTAVELVASRQQQWREDLAALIEDYRPFMGWWPATAPPPSSQAIPPPPEPAASLTPEFPAAQLTTWRIASFSGLVAGRVAHDRRDDDQETLLTGIHAFAAGRRAGTCLHQILEQAEFTAWRTAVSPADETQRVRTILAAHGLDCAEAHDGGPRYLPERAVAECLAALARGPLPGCGLDLGLVSRRQRRDEWRFHLGFADRSCTALVDAFARHGGARARAYAPHLAALDLHRLHGFLTGVIDCIVEQDGRWWIIDWKSNRLGADAAAYHAEMLWAEAMLPHHYVLQEHLYAVALHRHLRQRLGRGYDPERHLGGIAYIFLRGLDGEGIDVDQVPPALLEALDALLGPD